MNRKNIGISRWRKFICLALCLCYFLPSSAQRAWKKLEEHVVRDNETVYSIAKRYQASVEKIYELNPWAKQSIKAGDKLLIPTGSQAEQTPSVYRIVAGDTLYGVSKRLGVTEEELVRANPGISATNFPIGHLLRVPHAQTKGAIQEEATSVFNTQPTSSPVYISLLLPLTKVPRYVEFYEGFLMGMNDLKKVGISINLDVVDTPEDDDVATYISNGGLSNKDLVIGGVNEEQIRMISSATGYGYHIIPFSNTSDPTITSARSIQINNPSQDVVELVVPYLIRRYRQSEIYFVRRGQDNDDPLVRKLKTELSNQGKSYRTIELGLSSSENYGSDAVLIPVSPSKELAQTLLSRLQPDDRCTVLGYPQWQSYGDDLISALRRYNGSIYSTFYFDPNQNEAKTFLTKFFAWYNKKVTGLYPKYSVLGYDLARYFIRGWASAGQGFVNQASLLPRDGLQMDFSLSNLGDSKGYVNTNVYLVSFLSDGRTIRENL